MARLMASLGEWVVAYQMGATLLLVAASLGVLAMRGRPARRLVVVRSLFAGLVCLTIGEIARGVVSVTTEPGLSVVSYHEGGGVNCPCCVDAAREAGADRAGFLLAGGVFGVGGCAGLVWLGLGGMARRSLFRRSRPAAAWLCEELERLSGPLGARVRVRVVERLPTPMVMGWSRPTIFIPGEIEWHTPSRLTAALRHELAHVRNRDLAWQGVARVFLPLLFVNPLYWWLRGVAESSQELLADAAACSGGDRLAYAEALTFWARLRHEASQERRLGAIGFGKPGAQLRRRVERLLGEEPLETVTPGYGTRLVAGMGLVACLLLAALPKVLGAPASLEAGIVAERPTSWIAAKKAPLVEFCCPEPVREVACR